MPRMHTPHRDIHLLLYHVLYRTPHAPLLRAAHSIAHREWFTSYAAESNFRGDCKRRGLGMLCKRAQNTRWTEAAQMGHVNGAQLTATNRPDVLEDPPSMHFVELAVDHGVPTAGSSFRRTPFERPSSPSPSGRRQGRRGGVVFGGGRVFRRSFIAPPQIPAGSVGKKAEYGGMLEKCADVDQVQDGATSAKVLADV